MLTEGVSKPVILKELELKKDTLNHWIRQWRWENPSLAPDASPQPSMRIGKVADVRSVLEMVDAERPLKEISRETGVDRQTIRRWRDDPRCREATLEYDPLFPYDPDDLMDRAVVVQGLCKQTSDPGERLDLLMAAVGFGEDMDEYSVPRKTATRRKATR